MWLIRIAFVVRVVAALVGEVTVVVFGVIHIAVDIVAVAVVVGDGGVAVAAAVT